MVFLFSGTCMVMFKPCHGMWQLCASEPYTIIGLIRFHFYFRMQQVYSANNENQAVTSITM